MSGTPLRERVGWSFANHRLGGHAMALAEEDLVAADQLLGAGVIQPVVTDSDETALELWDVIDQSGRFDHDGDVTVIRDNVLQWLAGRQSLPEDQWQKMYVAHVENDRQFLQEVADSYGVRTDEITSSFLHQQGLGRQSLRTNPEISQAAGVGGDGLATTNDPSTSAFLSGQSSPNHRQRTRGGQMIQAICRVDHRPEGAGPGAVVATFDSMQDASNRQIEDSYPNCIIEYREIEER